MSTPYDGTNLPPTYTVEGANISTSQDYPTDFEYLKRALKSFTNPFVDFLKDERGDTSVNPHQPTFFGNPSYNHDSTTWHTRPNATLSKNLSSTTSLSFATTPNSYRNTYKIVLNPGTHEINEGESFSVYTPSKIVIGAAPNSNATYRVPVVFFDVVGFTGATGVTDNDLFRLRVQTGVTGLTQPLVATGSYAMFDRQYLKFLDNITELGFTATNPSVSGASGATFGFLTTLLGAYEVVSNGHSGNSSFTVEIPHMYSKGISGTPVGIPFGFSSNGISAATIYTTVLRVKNDDGFLFADAGTNVYIGTDGLDPLVIVNDGPGVTVANYTAGQFFSNSTGVHTLGKLTIGSGVVFRDFPTAILAQGSSRVKIDGGIFCGNYTAINMKESAVASLSDTIINRNVFGAIAQDGGHVNFLGAVAGESTPNVLSRNSGASIVAMDGGSVRVANMVVRESPALVAFEANSVKIDSLVADAPRRWLGSFGGTGGTASVVFADAGTSGSDLSVFVANTAIQIKEPSPASSKIFAVGPCEIPEIRLLGGDVRVETANSNNFALGATAVLSQTTVTKATSESKFIKSTVQKSSSAPSSSFPGPLDP
jgi:hypothetical protein